MKLYALADLHLRYEVTRQALQALRPHPHDWLILAGDVGETEEHLRFALAGRPEFIEHDDGPCRGPADVVRRVGSNIGWPGGAGNP